MAVLAKDDAGCEEAAQVLKAIAHPLRLRLVAILATGSMNVSGLAERLHTGQAQVSQQLRILRMHKLVAASRQHGFTIYRLAEPHLKKILRCLEDCIDSRRKA